MNKYFLISLFLWIGQFSYAQVIDSSEVLRIVPDTATTLVINDTTRVLQTDSLLIVQEDISDYPNPKKAAILGLVIPGAGHIYNKRFWYLKLPVVYGGLAGGVYLFQRSQSRYNIYQDAFCYKVIDANQGDIPAESKCAKHLGDENFSELSNASRREFVFFSRLRESSAFNAAALRTRRDNYDKQRQLSALGILVGHLVLNGVWSYVDAHLNGFDLDDDLTLHWKPDMEVVVGSNTPIVGMSIQLEF